LPGNVSSAVRGTSSKVPYPDPEAGAPLAAYTNTLGRCARRTKLRALYQRRKGRDLFDLWLCLSRGLVDPNQVVACFAAYMKHQGRTISRAEFERNLFEKESNLTFPGDISPLLAVGVSYDAGDAIKLVRGSLIGRLTGEPWRGMPSSPDASNHVEPRQGKRRTT